MKEIRNKIISILNWIITILFKLIKFNFKSLKSANLKNKLPIVFIFCSIFLSMILFFNFQFPQVEIKDGGNGIFNSSVQSSWRGYSSTLKDSMKQVSMEYVNSYDDSIGYTHQAISEMTSKLQNDSNVINKSNELVQSLADSLNKNGFDARVEMTDRDNGGHTIPSHKIIVFGDNGTNDLSQNLADISSNLDINYIIDPVLQIFDNVDNIGPPGIQLDSNPVQGVYYGAIDSIAMSVEYFQTINPSNFDDPNNSVFVHESGHAVSHYLSENNSNFEIKVGVGGIQLRQSSYDVPGGTGLNGYETAFNIDEFYAYGAQAIIGFNSKDIDFNTPLTDGDVSAAIKADQSSRTIYEALSQYKSENARIKEFTNGRAELAWNAKLSNGAGVTVKFRLPKVNGTETHSQQADQLVKNVLDNSKFVNGWGQSIIKQAHDNPKHLSPRFKEIVKDEYNKDVEFNKKNPGMVGNRDTIRNNVENNSFQSGSISKRVAALKERQFDVTDKKNWSDSKTPYNNFIDKVTGPIDLFYYNEDNTQSSTSLKNGKNHSNSRGISQLITKSAYKQRNPQTSIKFHKNSSSKNSDDNEDHNHNHSHNHEFDIGDVVASKSELFVKSTQINKNIENIYNSKKNGQPLSDSEKKQIKQMNDDYKKDAKNLSEKINIIKKSVGDSGDETLGAILSPPKPQSQGVNGQNSNNTDVGSYVGSSQLPPGDKVNISNSFFNSNVNKSFESSLNSFETGTNAAVVNQLIMNVPTHYGTTLSLVVGDNNQKIDGVKSITWDNYILDGKSISLGAIIFTNEDRIEVDTTSNKAAFYEKGDINGGGSHYHDSNGQLVIEIVKTPTSILNGVTLSNFTTVINFSGGSTLSISNSLGSGFSGNNSMLNSIPLMRTY